MAVCKKCGNQATWLNRLTPDGICALCWASEKYEHENADTRPSAAQDNPSPLSDDVPSILLTTETAPALKITERLDIITAEVVIGMHLFKDIAGAFRDVFGGRSKLMQDGLREARKTALAELRREAHALGADAVVAVDLDYSEISGGGKSMLFLVASGTAVKLAQDG